MHNPTHAASLHCEIIDDCPRRGVLIERDATDADHERGVDTFEEYDSATNRVQEYLCIAECEYLELIDDERADWLRAKAEAARTVAAMKGAA